MPNRNAAHPNQVPEACRQPNAMTRMRVCTWTAPCSGHVDDNLGAGSQHHCYSSHRQSWDTTNVHAVIVDREHPLYSQASNPARFVKWQWT